MSQQKSEQREFHVIKVGQHRGNRRIWIEGTKLAATGFQPGARYKLVQDPLQHRILLVLDDEGPRKVSRKSKGDKELPVIDINANDVLAVFEGAESAQLEFTRSTLLLSAVKS